MSLPLLTVGFGPDGLGASYAPPDGPPVAGRLDAAAVEAAARPVAATTPEAWSAAERDAALRVAGLLGGPGMAEVHAALAATRQSVGARPVPLLVDARTDPLRAVPWELAQGLDPAAHPLGGCRLRRLCPAGPLGAPERGLQVLVLIWAPETGDPRLAPLLADLTRALSALRRVAIRALPSDLSAVPAAPPGVPRILHVLTVGAGAAAAEARLVGGADPAATALVRSATLVVVDPVDASERAPAGPARLVAAGCPLVVAPRHGFAPDASRAFHRAFYGAVAAGRSVAHATEEGRRALAALALPHPGARPWVPSLHVGAPDAADRALLRPAALPKGWAMGSTDGEAVVAAALEHARGQGYLGVEHLALALSEWEPASDLIAAARHALVMVAGMLPGVEGPDPPVPSPRLAEAAASLPHGYDPEALLRMLATVPWVAERLGMAVLSRLQGGVRRPPPPSSRPPAPPGPLVFEVLAGPEDGRRIVLDAPGQVIGRWDADALGDDAHRLFVGGRSVDRSVSRRHVVYVGGREVEVLGYTRLERGGRVADVRGRLEVLPGDRLWLGAGTRLQA